MNLIFCLPYLSFLLISLVLFFVILSRFFFFLQEEIWYVFASSGFRGLPSQDHCSPCFRIQLNSGIIFAQSLLPHYRMASNEPQLHMYLAQYSGFSSLPPTQPLAALFLDFVDSLCRLPSLQWNRIYLSWDFVRKKIPSDSLMFSTVRSRSCKIRFFANQVSKGFKNNKISCVHSIRTSLLICWW